MKLTFLMAAHKLDQFIPLTVESIISQTDSDFECVIVANNCSDDLWEYLLSIDDPRIHCYRTVIGQLCFNLNFALTKTDADYIMRIDSDDICTPDRVLFTRQLLSEAEKPDVLAMSCEYINESGLKTNTVNKNVLDGNVKLDSVLWYRNPICHPGVAIRRESLLAVGGYSWGFASEDYDLWLRMSRANMQFKFSSLVGVHYRIREGQSRGGILPYSEVAGLMLREFLLTKRISFFAGALVAVLKALFRAKY